MIEREIESPNPMPPTLVVKKWGPIYECDPLGRKIGGQHAGSYDYDENAA
jgi:hypothetical protein